MKKTKKLSTGIAIIFSLFLIPKTYSQTSNASHRPHYATMGSDRARVITFNEDKSGHINENLYIAYGAAGDNWEWMKNIKLEVQREGGVGTRGGMFMDAGHLYLVADWDNSRPDEDIIFGFDSNLKGNVKEKMRLTDEGRLGIGTSSPKQKLHVNGSIYARGHTFYHAYEGDGSSGTAYLQARDNSGTSNIAFQFRTQKNGNITEALRITPNGNIGIGTKSPTVKLDVIGDARITGNATFQEDVVLQRDLDIERELTIKGDISTLGSLDIKKEINFSNVLNSQQVIVNKGVDFKLTNIAGSHFSVKNAFGSDALYIKTDGKIGFGAINPNNITEQMHVAGRIKASGFIADASSFPDYVFDKDYNLMPLQEVKKYTEKNRSLPGMPSEKEVTTNGLDIKKVVTISVEKIEELYLHIIKQEEELKKQQAENKAMLNLIKQLQKRVNALEKTIKQ